MDAKIEVPSVVALTVGSEKRLYVHLRRHVLTAVFSFGLGTCLGTCIGGLAALAGFLS